MELSGTSASLAIGPDGVLILGNSAYCQNKSDRKHEDMPDLIHVLYTSFELLAALLHAPDGTRLDLHVRTNPRNTHFQWRFGSQSLSSSFLLINAR